jgi:AraC-like DNA-binding protein
MTARSFRRQLGLEGSSFRVLLERVRQDKACELLAGGQRPVDEVARQLGYAEAASFIHAFRRWTGQTPAAWRKSTDRPGTGSRPAET